MAYHNDFAFSMPQAQRPNMYFAQQMPFAGFPQHQLHPDSMGLPFTRFPDYPEHMYYHDLEEVTETTTRPRLTKQQVDRLEGEFQRNAKPNSGKKRMLAQMTSLTLPRVSNWFQNRRAKAKQQRKQEEYESAQQRQVATQEEQADESEDDDEEATEDDAQEPDSNDQSGSATPETLQPNQDRQQHSIEQDHDITLPSAGKRENAQASLERALAQARNAQAAQMVHHESRPELSVQQSMTAYPAGHDAGQRYPQNAQLDSIPWTLPVDTQESWLPPPPTGNAISLEFDFSSMTSQSFSDQAQLPSPAETSSRGFKTPELWSDSLVTPTMTNASHGANAQPLPSPDLSMSAFADYSRRPSIADTLSQSFDQVPLAHSLSAQGSLENSESTGGIDLASRRRRPRPAALTSTALRTRSYGTLTNSSPTFKPGMTPPSAQALRHVKSTGHCLNNHYAGIRKSSIPQKSPLALSFQESEELKRLVAQRTFEEDSKQQQSPLNDADIHAATARQDMNSVMSQTGFNNMTNTNLSQQHANVQSPPVTPFNQNFFQYGQSMVPHSIQSQYAMVSETPPYSAGPLTHSSFQDRPFISPDVPNFPQTQLIPNLPYTSAGDDQALNAWMFTDQSPVYTTCTLGGNKEQEWHVHEFPDQREKLADTAKLLDRPTIRSWSFDNRGQHDFAS